MALCGTAEAVPFVHCNSSESATLPRLKLIPQVLVVDIMVVLQLGRLHKGAQQTRAAVSGSFLQFRVALLYIGSQQGVGPLRSLKIFECCIDVVRQEPLGLTKILDLRRLPLNPVLKTE